jgi:hypothetical protein
MRRTPYRPVLPATHLNTPIEDEDDDENEYED